MNQSQGGGHQHGGNGGQGMYQNKAQHPQQQFMTPQQIPMPNYPQQAAPAMY